MHRLYSEGVTLVIVVDGKATPLKWTAMDQREGRASTRGGCGRKTGRRTQLDNKMKEVKHIRTIIDTTCGRKRTLV